MRPPINKMDWDTEDLAWVLIFSTLTAALVQEITWVIFGGPKQ